MADSNTRKKKHADFQDRYRRSSNFRKAAKAEAFRIGEDGTLIMINGGSSTKQENRKS